MLSDKLGALRIYRFMTDITRYIYEVLFYEVIYRVKRYVHLTLGSRIYTPSVLVACPPRTLGPPPL